MAEYRILAIGDIVGAESTDRVCRAVGRLRNEYRADLVIANGENAARGNGLDRVTAESLLSSGIDVLTSGNHIWQKHGMQDYIDGNRFVLRPANYPSGTPGKGFVVYDSCGTRVLVMNVLGTVFMEPLACPFEAVEKMLAENAGEYCISFLDIHAEATSEKLALAYYFDGRISAVCGTHTHVQSLRRKGASRRDGVYNRPRNVRRGKLGSRGEKGVRYRKAPHTYACEIREPGGGGDVS